MEEFLSSFLRRAGMPASAGLSCFTFMRHTFLVVTVQMVKIGVHLKKLPQN